MQKHETLALAIYFLLPFIGLSVFLWLRDKMKQQKIVTRPSLAYFIIFATYGGLLQLFLTVYFKLDWSGMASLGTFYSIVIGPILMIIIAYYYLKQKQLSKYHNWAFKIAASYFIIAPIVFLIAYKLITSS